MIKQYTPAQVFQLYSNSSPDIKEALISIQTADKIGDICQTKHKFSDEQMMNTAKLVGQVLFGLIHPDELVVNFQKELNISPAQAKTLYQDIWEVILKPVEANLKRIHGPIKPAEAIEIESVPKPVPTPKIEQKKERYLEPSEEEIKIPSPPPIKKPELKQPELKTINIDGIPIAAVQRQEPKERTVTPPRLSSLYLEPIEEEMDKSPQNVVDLRTK